MALSGIVSFSLEVTWTRLLGHVIGGSIYAFAVMLATFLLGIALGAGFAGRLATGPRRAWVILGAAEVAIGLLSLGTYFIMSTAVPGERSWASALVYAAAIMLPATVCIGATFPLAVRAAARTVEEAPAVAGGIYAANTAGAIAGAILTGLVLLPWIGFTGVARAASTTSIVLGVAMLTLLPGTGRPQQALGAILVLLVVLLPLPRPDAVINATSMRAGSTQGEELFYAVGRSATVMAKSFGGNITLRTNGLPEAAIATHGMPPMRNSQHWLGALPHFARPGAHSALVVGLGGGVVLEGIPPHAQGTLTVVELEREVLHANRVIEPYRRHAILDREGVRYVINDARSALLLDRNRYDVIISQPSHPWTAGASHLYTREFIQLARTRLNPDGVFLQWIHSEFLDEALLRSLAATLLSQFSHVELFEPVPGVLEFLASSRPLDDSWLPSRLQRVLQRDSDHFKGIGISDPLDILAARVLSTAGVQALAAGAPVNTDNRNRLATASRSRGEGLSSEDLVRILGDNDTFCAGARPPQHHLALDEAFYVHRQWQLSGFVARSAHCTALAQGPLRVLSAAHALMVRGDRTKAVQLLTANGLLDGSTPDATYLASLLALAGQGSGELPPLEGLPPGAKATLAAWKAAQADEWETVRTLDKALSTTATHDTWFTDAAKLMSEWRIRQAVTMNSAAPLEVARAIIDSGLSVQWTEDLLILRIGVASMLRDGNLFLGSTQAYLSTLERRLEPARTAGPAAVPLDALTQKRLRGIAAQLAGLDALLPQAETRGITQRIDALLDAKPGGRS
jgi:predicted membrane-bound spermidine synthase